MAEIIDFNAYVEKRNQKNGIITEIFYEQNMWHARYGEAMWHDHTLQGLYAQLGWEYVEEMINDD